MDLYNPQVDPPLAGPGGTTYGMYSNLIPRSLNLDWDIRYCEWLRECGHIDFRDLLLLDKVPSYIQSDSPDTTYTS